MLFKTLVLRLKNLMILLQYWMVATSFSLVSNPLPPRHYLTPAQMSLSSRKKWKRKRKKGLIFCVNGCCTQHSQFTCVTCMYICTVQMFKWTIKIFCIDYYRLDFLNNGCWSCGTSCGTSIDNTKPVNLSVFLSLNATFVVGLLLTWIYYFLH